jgi:AraC-like DNA-binding protein
MSMNGFQLSDPVVPMHHPRVLVQVAQRQGGDIERLLVGTDIDRAMLDKPEARISYVQFGLLTHNALLETGNPALGLDFGRALHLSNHGMLGLAILSSPTVADAFETGLQYHRNLAPAWNLELERSGDEAVLTAVNTIPFGSYLAFATESLFAAVDSLARFLIGSAPALRSCHLAFPRPDYASRYAEIADITPVFEAPPSRVVFDASVLDIPLATSDPLTLELARRQCEADLPENVSGHSLLEQVRRYIGSAPPAYPDVAQTARFLCTSPRSLRRALRRFGTSHQELVDEARKARALATIPRGQMTVEQLSTHLGFNDPRSFRRAFTRWTGQSFRDYRDAVRRERSSPARSTSD